MTKNKRMKILISGLVAASTLLTPPAVAAAQTTSGTSGNSSGSASSNSTAINSGSTAGMQHAGLIEAGLATLSAGGLVFGLRRKNANG